jgi:hypothetical protein
VDWFRPTISALKPPDWFGKESITLLAPDGQANVIASCEPLEETIDTDTYAGVQGDLLEKEFPGYKQFAFEPKRVFGGRDGRIRRFQWTPPDGEPVTQIQLYYAEAGYGYTATATTPTRQFADVELQLTEILEGLTVDGRAASAATDAAGN